LDETSGLWAWTAIFSAKHRDSGLGLGYFQRTSVTSSVAERRLAGHILEGVKIRLLEVQLLALPCTLKKVDSTHAARFVFR
jgi:hypothetical protein